MARRTPLSLIAETFGCSSARIFRDHEMWPEAEARRRAGSGESEDQAWSERSVMAVLQFVRAGEHARGQRDSGNVGGSRMPEGTMSYTTVGLTNGGRTAHYQIQYDDTLPQADGMDRANGLIAACEDDYALVSGWFDDIALTVGIPVTVQIAPGAYASAGWGPPITLKPGDGSSIEVVRYLLVSEVTEMFMLAQNKGWFGAGNEGSAGEGLSRFLAGQFLIASGLGVTEPGFALANSWMSTPRADYVNNIDVLDHRRQDRLLDSLHLLPAHPAGLQHQEHRRGRRFRALRRLQEPDRRPGRPLPAVQGTPRHLLPRHDDYPRRQPGQPIPARALPPPAATCRRP